MSRWEGTRMASDRAVTTRTTATAAAHGLASSVPTRDTTQASGRRCLKRAALYARVSTDKQEREETVASQVDLLHQTAEAHGYEVLPGNIFIDDGISGTRSIGLPWSAYGIWWPKASLRCCWSRPLTGWLAAMPIRWYWWRSSSGVGAKSSSCSSPSARALRNRCSSRCRGSLQSMNGR
jgi:hypothetical protein